MSEAKAQASNEDHEAERIYWPRFLESQPPGQSRKITGVAQPHPTGTADLVVLPVQLYCDSEECSGLRYFDSASSGSLNPANAWHKQFLDYRCRHCKKTMKIYAVLVLRNTTGRDGEAVKVGEWPPFGPHVPTKMFSLIGQDQELFLKGRRGRSSARPSTSSRTVSRMCCESMGIIHLPSFTLRSVMGFTNSPTRNALIERQPSDWCLRNFLRELSKY